MQITPEEWPPRLARIGNRHTPCAMQAAVKILGGEGPITPHRINQVDCNRLISLNDRLTWKSQRHRSVIMLKLVNLVIDTDKFSKSERYAVYNEIQSRLEQRLGVLYFLEYPLDETIEEYLTVLARHVYTEE